ncbi:MAG: hypothetical protein IKE65_09530 [Clostridia bacterium]|nr:hypothetical protein [Clostridia bacterium]
MMKKLIAILLASVMLLSFAACSKDKQEQTTQATTKGATTQEQTTAAPEPSEVYDFDVLEQELKAHAFAYLGGFMSFVTDENKMYYCDSDYNTKEVMYYDFTTGKAESLVQDAANPLSGPFRMSNKSVVVLAATEQTDPLQYDWTKGQNHIYDYQSGKIIQIPNNLEFVVCAYNGAKLYGYNAQKNFVIADETGKVEKTVAFDAAGDNSSSIGNFYFVGGKVYVDVAKQSGHELYAIGEDSAESVVENAGNFYFNGSAFCYMVNKGGSSELMQYLPESGETTSVAKIEEEVYHLFFVAGDRFYYSVNNTSEDAGNQISLKYFDIKKQQDSTFASDTPVLGGW